ncbi:thioredoxin [Desulfurococcaceae archaeon MEX13E-LK6-19]|nr:thioredoxin [Desulfurococcaceae archaeon MEX13E-LK6-19]
MIEIRDVVELKRALNFYKVVIIEYYDPDDEVSREFSKAVKMLQKHLDPDGIILRVSTKEHPELASDVKTIPCLRVYLNGKLVFEQQGGFGNRELDLTVLRRSIRHTLRSLNVAFRI